MKNGNVVWFALLCLMLKHSNVVFCCLEFEPCTCKKTMNTPWNLFGLDKSGKQIRITRPLRQPKVQVSDKIQLIMNMLDKAESCFVDFFSAACAPKRMTHNAFWQPVLGLASNVIFLFHLFVVQYLLFQRAPRFDVSICWMIAVVEGEHDDHWRRHGIHLFEDQGCWHHGNNPLNCMRAIGPQIQSDHFAICSRCLK